MNLDNIDFYDILLDEGHPFYREMYQFEENCINSWFRQNLKFYGEVKVYTDVQPPEEMVNTLTENGYIHVGHQCHYSAKRLNQIDKEYKYITGVVFRNEFPYGIITHSFNIYNDKIVDFARLDNDIVILENDETLPHLYYGVELPNDFVSEFTEETIEHNSMKPLIFEWFERNGFCKKKKLEV